MLLILLFIKNWFLKALGHTIFAFLTPYVNFVPQNTVLCVNELICNFFFILRLYDIYKLYLTDLFSMLIARKIISRIH